MELPQNNKEWIITILIILAVVAIGWFMVNQYLEFRYNFLLITNPCELCKELTQPPIIEPRIISEFIL